MANLGTILGGFGASYPTFQKNQLQMAMEQLALQKAKQEEAVRQATMQQAPAALKAFSQLQGTGPGGAVMPQQIAALTQNPELFNQLVSSTRSPNTGLFGINRAGVMGEYGLDRAQTAADAAQKRAETAGQYGVKRAETAGKYGVERAQLANEGAKQREGMREGAAASRQSRELAAGKYSGRGAGSRGKNLDYEAAKSEYLESEKDMRSLQNIYRDTPDPSAIYSDPKWLEIRKRRDSALTAMKSTAAGKKSESKETAAPAAVTVEPGEPTATDAAGNTLVVRNGAWVKASGK